MTTTPAPVFEPADILAADDADLDRHLTRLYRLHGEAGRDSQVRVELHAGIEQILTEQQRRRDVWLGL